jgi:hypothetical protein
VTYTTTALLFLEHTPTQAEHATITAVVADGQRFAALDTTAAGGRNPYVAAVYAAAFDYVTPAQIEAFVSRLPMRGDVVLYARTQSGARPLLRIREDIREDTPDPT